MLNLIILANVLVFVGILFASLVPGKYRPRSGFDGHIEHAFAYLVGGLVILPFLNTIDAVGVSVIVLVALAAVMEIGQTWVPARSCRLSHFAASVAGALAAGAIGVMTVG